MPGINAPSQAATSPEGVAPTNLKARRTGAYLWLSLGVLLVVSDLIGAGQAWYLDEHRVLFSLLVIFLQWLCCRDLGQMGLRLKTAQGAWYWCRLSLQVGLAVLLLGALGLAVFYLITGRLPVLHAFYQRDDLLRWAWLLCGVVPLIEELIYRVALCAPLVWLGHRRLALMLSGLSFGLLHIFFGNPSPDNLLAGYFLAWTFLKSGSLLVPLALHSLGNTLLLLAFVFLA